MAYIYDKATKLKATIDEETGFLTATVTLARIGIQDYLSSELELDDEEKQVVKVFRSVDEVSSDDSIKSFTNLIVTNNHPLTPVSVANVKSLQTGTVSGVFFDDKLKVLKGIITITDQKTIKAIQSGKKEVSVGYSNDLVKKTGLWDGQKYDYIQKNIKANHLAIVQAGRCGSACKITTDNKEKIKMAITIDGISFDTDNPQLEQAIKKMQDAFDAEKNAFMKKLEEKKKEKDEAEKEKIKAEKEKDEAKAKADVIEKDKKSDDDIAKLVTEKAILLSDAKAILGDYMPECLSCDSEIKSAVVKAVLDMEMSGKSTDYINASYDIAIAKAKKTSDNLENFKKDFQSKDGKTVDSREESRKNYMKDFLKVEEA